MPNDFKSALLLLALLALAGCVTTSADPNLLLEADDAIELAQQSGARDHASLELDESLELREQAAAMIDEDEAAAAARLAERAALQARLAIVRAEGARARGELQAKRNDLDKLETELRADFGDAIEFESQPQPTDAGDTGDRP